MDKYLAGKSGFLFLSNDNNKLMLQISGKAAFRPDFFQRLAAIHMRRYDNCQKIDCEYAHIIVPNKETSLRAMLPEAIYETNGPTPAHRYLTECPSIRNFTFYDADLLCYPSFDTEYYSRQDSHWTTTGAVKYLQAAFDYLKLADMDVLRQLTFKPTELSLVGDLGLHASLGVEHYMDSRVAYPRNTYLHKGKVGNRGYVQHQRLNQAPQRSRRIVVFHDSFGWCLFDAFGNTWGECLSLHMPEVGWNVIQAFRPNLLLILQIERFMPHMPNDGPDMIAMLREVYAQKGVSSASADYLKATLGLEQTMVTSASD